MKLEVSPGIFLSTIFIKIRLICCARCVLLQLRTFPKGNELKDIIRTDNKVENLSYFYYVGISHGSENVRHASKTESCGILNRVDLQRAPWQGNVEF